MRRAVGADIGEGVEPAFVTSIGSPAQVIVEQTIALPADLVVMGTHGRSGFDRLVSGSITEKVLRRAPCPVLTIPPHTPADAGHAVFKRILCAVDFSPASKQALGFALDLARQAQGRVDVVTVVEWIADESLADLPASVGEYQKALADVARTRLRGLLADEPRTWADIEEIVTSGRADREILRLAGERQSDLIVMGTHGRGGLGLAFLGSTTPPVVRGATCPVLVVHEPVGA
jgi:nucleotide-binding universal stress UspA family protein